MVSAQQKIELYVTQNGRVPFQDWLESLKDISARALVRVRLDRIRLGNFGDCKHVGTGIFELRVNFGPGYRVYFGRIGGKIVLLLFGGNKSGQKKDILKAHEYWTEYRRSHK